MAKDNNRTKKCDDCVLFFNYDDSGSYYEFNVSRRGIARSDITILTAKQAQKVIEQHELGVRLFAAYHEENDALRDLNRRVDASRLAIANAQKELNKLELEQSQFKTPAAEALRAAKLQRPRSYGITHLPGKIRVGCNQIPLWVAKKAVRMALAMRPRRK